MCGLSLPTDSTIKIINFSYTLHLKLPTYDFIFETLLLASFDAWCVLISIILAGNASEKLRTGSFFCHWTEYGNLNT
jgi:hypothetical protein